MTTMTATMSNDPFITRCPAGHECEWVAGDSPTGVVAPDGGCEVRWESGWYCDACGKLYDPTDIEDEGE